MALAKYKTHKDSGVQLFGDVPSHWEVKRIKDFTIRIGSGITPKGGSSVYVDKGVTFLRSQNVYDDGLRIDNVSFISEETHDKMNSSKLKPDDVLMNITGASIARTCLVPKNLKEANINQ
ncbi:MAG: restriction endonuclease subunit S, partial [Bacteroidota bacterium]